MQSTGRARQGSGKGRILVVHDAAARAGCSVVSTGATFPSHHSSQLTMIASPAMFLPAMMVAVVAVSILPASAEPRRAGPDRPNADAEMRKRENELEAVALQILLAPMFNSSRKGSMGTGAAGRHWDAMMVESIARQLAKHGGLRLLPGRRKGSGRPQAEAESRLLRGAAPLSCISEKCRLATATIGEWRTTVSHGDGQEAQKPMGGAMVLQTMDSNQ
jgi:hypothetical protein